jgi:pilus assembly protein CpaB
MTRRRRSTVSSWITAAVMGLCVVVAGGLTWSVLLVFAVLEASLDTALVDAREITTDVVVMRRTLARGSTVTAEDLEVRSMGEDYVSAAVLRDPQVVIGRVVRERLLAGDLVREERLAPWGAGSDLTATIATGMRAISLDLDEQERVAGFVEPGDRVDVVVTLPASDDREAETRTLMQAVDVLAVEARISETAEGDELHASHVTLGVTPGQAEALTLVAEEAVPQLVLRSEIDFVPARTDGTTTASLIGRPDQRRSIAQYTEQVDDARYDDMIELYHGRRRTVERVSADSALVARVLED